MESATRTPALTEPNAPPSGRWAFADRTQLLISTIGGGAIGAILGSLLVATQSASTSGGSGWIGAQWIAALLMVGATTLVGIFVGAMLTRTAVQGLRMRFAAQGLAIPSVASRLSEAAR